MTDLQILPGLTRDEMPAFFCHHGFEVGVEIGVQRGKFSEQILKAWPGKLYLIDPWESQHQEACYCISDLSQEVHDVWYAETVERMKLFGDRSVIRRGFSTAEGACFEDESIDFVYLNGNHHSHESMLNNLRMWFPVVRFGGIVAGYNFLDGDSYGCTLGVKSAVTEFLANTGKPVYVGPVPWPNWYFWR